MTKHSPIRNRLTAIGAAVVAVVLAATALSVEMQRMAAIDAFRTAITNLGTGMSRQTNQTLSAADGVLREVQEYLAASRQETSDEIAAIMVSRSASDILVTRGARLYEVDSVSLVDATGRIANSSVSLSAGRVDVSDTDFFRHFKATDDRSAFVGMPSRDRVTGEWTIVLARRIDDAHGGFAGLAIAKISLTDLQNFYRLAMPGRRTVYVVRTDGVILTRYPERDAEIGRKIPGQSPWYAVTNHGGGLYQGTDYFDGTLIIASVHPLRGLPFVIEASVSESDALSNWYVQRIWVILGGLLAVVGAVLLLRLFDRQYHQIELSERSLANKNAELDSIREQLEVTLANLAQGVCCFDSRNRLVVFNRRYCELFGLSENAVRADMSIEDIFELRTAAGRMSAQSAEQQRRALEAVIVQQKPHDATVELTDGRVISTHFQPLPGGGWIKTCEDVTERRKAEAKVSFLASHDPLTGLANRAEFKGRLAQALAQAKRGEGFALLCLDLDRFKAVNDSLGHAVGDRLLCAVAERLRGVMRQGDTIARLGGDEFAIVQLGASEPAASEIVARRLVEAIAETFEFDTLRIRIGVSIGIALAPMDSLDPEQLLKDADDALYRAKRQGRSTWQFFNAGCDAVG